MDAMFFLPKSDVPSIINTQVVFSDHKFLPDFYNSLVNEDIEFEELCQT